MEQHTHAPLLPLFLVSLLAFIIPILTTWFSKKYKIPIPTVVGEIICGIIIGKSFLGLIESTDTIPWLDFLSLFGFTYLMFLSGLEVDINTLTSRGKPGQALLTEGRFYKKPIFLGLSHFGLTLILSSLISLTLHINGVINNWMMMTLILSTTSVSIVVPVLKERALSKTVLGQTILLSALVADFLTMILITILVAFSVSGKSSFTILVLILMIGLFILLYRLHLSKTFDGLIAKLFFIKPLLNELAHTTTQIKVRGAIALMIIFIVTSQAMGFEVILGAFLAGIFTTLILGEDKTDELEMKLDAIGYGFFIPIFFLSVGIDLDLRVFFTSDKAWYLLLFLIISAFAIKIIPSLIFTLRFKLKESLSAGVLLASRLSLIIAASTIGLKEGMISEEVNAAIVMVAVISCTISPVIFNRITEYTKKTTKEYFTILGANETARKLYEYLNEHTDKITLIATKGEEYYICRKLRLPVVKKVKSIEETLIKAGINNTKALILTTDDDDYNIKTALAAKNSFGLNNIVTLVNNEKNIEAFKVHNVEPVTQIQATVKKLATKAIFPNSEYLATVGDNEINFVDVVLKNHDFEDLKIKNIVLPGDTLIVHISRGEDSIVPHANTKIHLYDHLTLVGDYKSVQETVNLLNSPNGK